MSTKRRGQRGPRLKSLLSFFFVFKTKRRASVRALEPLFVLKIMLFSDNINVLNNDDTGEGPSPLRCVLYVCNTKMDCHASLCFADASLSLVRSRLCLDSAMTLSRFTNHDQALHVLHGKIFTFFIILKYQSL